MKACGKRSPTIFSSFPSSPPSRRSPVLLGASNHRPMRCAPIFHMMCHAISSTLRSVHRARSCALAADSPACRQPVAILALRRVDRAMHRNSCLSDSNRSRGAARRPRSPANRCVPQSHRPASGRQTRSPPPARTTRSWPFSLRPLLWLERRRFEPTPIDKTRRTDRSQAAPVRNPRMNPDTLTHVRHHASVVALIRGTECGQRASVAGIVGIADELVELQLRQLPSRDMSSHGGFGPADTDRELRIHLRRRNRPQQFFRGAGPGMSKRPDAARRPAPARASRRRLFSHDASSTINASTAVAPTSIRCSSLTNITAACRR